MAYGASCLAACAPAQPDVKQSYEADRAMSVDQRQPCFITPYSWFPVKVLHHRIYVPININGVATVGVFDTGAASTLITPELAEAAHVKLSAGQMPFRGATGDFAAKAGIFHSIAIGSVVTKGNLPAFVYPFAGSHGTELGVQLGLDWLDALDWDMDLPHERLRPFSVRNCFAIDLPWRDSYTGLALSPESLDTRRHQGIYGIFSPAVVIPVTFEGGDLDAALDTGTSRSLLSYDAAHQVGVTTAELDADPVETIRGLNGGKASVYLHTFKDVAIGEQELRNVTWGVAHDFDRRDVPMILGMDYIGQHRVWLSFGTRAFYIDSGERRKPVPPLDAPHVLPGTLPAPYPKNGPPQGGTVKAQCTVAADGSASGCRVTGGSGNAVLNAAALSWLMGENGPLLQPAYRDGVAVPAPYTTTINYESDAPAGAARNAVPARRRCVLVIGAERTLVCPR